jgi:hypothetical protein
MNLNQLLNGCNFQQIADVTVCREWPRSMSEQPFSELKTKREYFDGAIIFCDAYYLLDLFKEIKDHENRYILISHLRDINITKELFEFRPKCIKKWFAQNADYIHPDLIPIPIGVENHSGSWKGTLIDLNFWENYDINEKYTKEELLYINFSGIGSPYFSHYSRQDWLNHLISEGFNVTERLPSVENLNKVKKHYFCASPRGNGIDCHRTWEALYFDCLPIVPCHFMYDTFNLPIVQVSNERLINKNNIEYVLERYNNKELIFNKKILTMDYWFSKIKEEKEKIL